MLTGYYALQGVTYAWRFVSGRLSFGTPHLHGWSAERVNATHWLVSRTRHGRTQRYMIELPTGPRLVPPAPIMPKPSKRRGRFVQEIPR